MGSDPVVISDKQGHERIRLGEIVETTSGSAKPGAPPTNHQTVTGDWWGLKVKNASGADVIAIGDEAPAGAAASGPHGWTPHSNVVFGGGGFDGHLQMKIAGGTVVVEAKAGAQTKPAAGSPIQFASQPIDFTVGGAFVPGTVSALSGQTAGVHIRSAPPGIDFMNSDKAQARLDGGHGDLWLGGNGQDSDIYLFDKSGDNATAAQSTVHIRGANPGIGMRVAGGKPTVRVDGPAADIWLGGNGADGAIVVFDKSGDNGTLAKATIMIDGAKGDIALQNADCAEEFDLSEEAVDAEPGTVLVIDADGRLRPSADAYDRRVAGVVSGAGSLRPAITLGRDPSASPCGRVPVALVGRVFCKVDAGEGPIEVGDLLTTALRAGYAMKAIDPARAFGAVLGKALAPLRSATGLIPILVTLQ